MERSRRASRPIEQIDVFSKLRHELSRFCFVRQAFTLKLTNFEIVPAALFVEFFEQPGNSLLEAGAPLARLACVNFVSFAIDGAECLRKLHAPVLHPPGECIHLGDVEAMNPASIAGRVKQDALDAAHSCDTLAES